MAIDKPNSTSIFFNSLLELPSEEQDVAYEFINMATCSMPTVSFLDLPRELRIVMYDQVWRSSPNLTFILDRLKLEAVYGDQVLKDSDPIWLPTWLLSNKQIMYEDLEQHGLHCTWSCTEWKDRKPKQKPSPLVFPIKSFERPFLIHLTAHLHDLSEGSWFGNIDASAQPGYVDSSGHLGNIGRFLDECTDSEQVEVDIVFDEKSGEHIDMCIQALCSCIKGMSLCKSLGLDCLVLTVTSLPRNSIWWTKGFKACILKRIKDGCGSMTAPEDVVEVLEE